MKKKYVLWLTLLLVGSIIMQATSKKDRDLSSHLSDLCLLSCCRFESNMLFADYIEEYKMEIRDIVTDDNTQCNPFNIPFWEGFNTDSKTLDCWTIYTNPNGGIPTATSNIWHTYDTSFSEGDQSIRFSSLSNYAPHDDWLISPVIMLDSSKVYKLTYDYKTSAFSDGNEFKVLLSKGGIAKSNFSTTLLTKKGHSSTTWETEALFIQGISGNINLAWQVTTPLSSTVLYLDNVRIVIANCMEGVNLDVKDIESNKATIVWEDELNTNWEYIVQTANGGYPNNVGISTTTNEVTVIKTNSGANLNPNKEYEFYVRAKCLDGTFGDWIGPFVFKTDCSAVNLPFTETFETDSATLDCWTIIDVHGDSEGTTTILNTWGLYSSSVHAYEGTYSQRFYGGLNKTYDDWLISPIIQMKNTDIYQLTYYYRTHESYENNFEVKLSVNGTDPSEFTTTLLASKTYKNGNYEKKILYITGVDGNANIAWHVISGNSDRTYVYLDDIKLEKIDCIGPEDDIIISDLEIDKAKFNWTDTENSQWETYVQSAGSGQPTGSGTLVTSKPVTVTRTNGTGSGNLEPDTEYDFWVRSTCGPGKNSGWVGPFPFKTPCDVQPLPFWEGFNKTSTTLSCWIIVDNNKDVISNGDNIWKIFDYDVYEGDQMMYFYGYQNDMSKSPHDDWLISPVFKLNATKYYRLRYHYKTDISYKTHFEVSISNNGSVPSEFKKVLLAKAGYGNHSWDEQKIIIGGESGNINIGWHVTTPDTGTYLYIDNVFFEEIDCPEPVELGSKDEKENKATIYWQDNFGSDWEYVVQKAGGLMPISVTKTTTAKNKEVVVTKDKNADNLVHNTEYEFYVRTGCGNGKYGEWSGPYIFKTACGVFTTPFWEGFNNNSNTLECWTIIDRNNDSTSPTGNNIWKTSTINYEGVHCMYFQGGQSNASLRPHDDWLLSPTITFDAGKTYRLKYHYRTASTTTYDYEFEVLLSNSGIDNMNKFTTTVVPKKKYDPTTAWEEEYVFISGVSGDVNIAWHVTSSTQYTYVYIDNVFVEEVQGCPEPLPVTLGIKDEKSDRVTLLWDDNFGATAWEYYIQEEGGIVPTGTGIATANKETIATLDGTGNTLKPNTDYEFYVRTDCGNGEFSIWQGPYQFTTACGVYDTPFWDGFNTADKTYRCWTIIDGNGDSTSPTGSNIWRLYDTASGVYEGDQSMYFYGLSGKTHDDWLISPTIEMDPSLYVLKYRYKTSATTTYNSSFEILLSSQGVDTTKFTTTVLPTEVYREANWKERVVFFNGIAGDVNLGWHVNSTGTTYVYLDDVTIKKVETCPEPYHVTITNEASTSIELEWEQYGGITSWEVIVVNYGEDETATPVQKVTVSGTPKTTVTGLSGGKAYTVYVRAKCEDGKSSSDWSTAVDTGTKAGANDECSGAVNIPVNKGMDCEQTVAVSMMGATESALAQPGCSTSKKSDIWFEFTATHEDHTIKLEDWKNLEGKSSVTSLYGAIYDQPCSSMTDAVLCFTFTSASRLMLVRGFTVGQKYYLRLGTTSTTELRDIFNMCITSSYFLEVSPSGEEYTVDELVKDVLIQSDCDLVSNVRYQVGDGSPATHSINTLGYFNKNNSVFPFEEGIVLSTSEVQFVPGPFSTAAKGNNTHRWTGDKDINDAIYDAGGGPRDDKRVTQLEFDFIPVKDSIKFDYLFASNSYMSGCTYTCENGALFAAWLIDITTGEGQNLAKIKGTQTPISLYTIWDNEKIKNTTCSSHPELFWNAYNNGNANPLEAPINFAGSTIDMSSETVYVVPGRKYHIKLAVMDFCPTQSHSSAVFFSAGSFDLGNLDLGADLLVETGNAICGGECVTIKSGLGGAGDIDVDVEIQWYKDGVAIPGATKPEYEACESGTYKVVGKYPEINCEVEGEKVIEIWPPISTVVHKPEGMEICRYSLNERAIDLLSVEAEMFADVEREDYEVSYYLTQEDADQGNEDQMIGTPYVIEGGEDFSVFIRVVDTRTGCYEVFIFRVRQQQGAIPTKLADVSVCAEYVFPQVNGDQYYYTEPGGQGKEYKVGDVLAEPGEHTIYLLQLNNDEGCYEETVYQVNITAPVTADIFEDETPICQLYELKPLSEHNKYFEEPGGNGRELQPGMLISTAQTIYVYASSDNGLCTDESSFTIDYEDCPIPRGISPNGDGKNDTFDLSLHGVQDIKIYNRWGTEVYSHGDGYTNQWYGQNKDGKQLPDGTYYYVIHAHGKVRTGWVQINK